MPSRPGVRRDIRLGKISMECVMTRPLIAVFLLALSGIAAAQDSDFSYSYLQLSYTKADFDNVASDGDGLGLTGSLELSPNFHVFGAYTGLDVGSSADASGWKLGMGLNTPLSRLMDIVVRLSWQSTEVPAPGPLPGTVDNDGLGFGAGLRVGANEWIEVYGGLTYLDLDSGNETVFDAGFLLNLNDAFAVGVSGSWDEDVSAWSIDGRLYFD
jgi:hypothetical protein